MSDDFNWEGAGQGALGGAMTGASIGSAAGPWGAVIGGAVGLVGGGLIGGYGGGGAKEYEERLKNLAQGYKNVPQLGKPAQASYSSFRENQAALIAQLEALARGEAPSAAQIQMREAMDRAVGAQASAAAGAGGRGVNAGAAYRQASNNMAAVQQQGARDTATLRAAEQANAYGLLGQAIGQGRMADESMSQFNAGQQNATSLANMDAKLRAMGITSNVELQSLLAAMGAAGPGMGTQLLGAGAQAVGPALQYSQAQQQMENQKAMQQQQMDMQMEQQQYMRQQQQLLRARQQMRANPSTPNTGWGYSQPQGAGQPYPYQGQQNLPEWLTPYAYPSGQFSGY